jgi:hypothetical protein
MEFGPINIQVNKFFINKTKEVLQYHLINDIIYIIVEYFNQDNLIYSRNSEGFRICKIFEYEFIFQGINYFGMVRRLLVNSNNKLIISKWQYTQASAIINCFLEKYYNRENFFSIRDNGEYYYKFESNLCTCHKIGLLNSSDVEIVHATNSFTGNILCIMFLNSSSFLRAIEILEDFINNDYPFYVI